jgi:choline kinase
MDALIIAAGYGSRLADLSPSKPLTPIAGVPLLELGLRNAKAAGAGKVVVVTGHAAERIEQVLPALADRAGIMAEAARIDDWSRPNGWSVMAGAERIAGDYLLMMADHIFAPSILQRLARQGAPTRGVTLAIDRRTASPLIDPEDATWVQTREDGFIRAIGKTIPAWDAVDCGAFLATPELARAIGEAITGGKAGSLSEGMQVLADRGRAATYDIGADENDAWWMDVDDPRAHELAEALAPRFLAEYFVG